MSAVMPGIMHFWAVLKAVLQFVLPLLLLVLKLPRRGRTPIRLALVAAAFFAYDALQASAQASALSTGSAAVSYWVRFGAFALLLFLAAAAVMFVFECTVWTSLFCCTASWAIQNLISSVHQVLLFSSMLVSSGAHESEGYNVVAMLVVYPLCYLLFIRKIVRRGLVAIEDRGILAMYAFVVLLVLGFDVTLRAVGGVAGVSAGLLLALWSVHMGICAFALFTEYEVLYNRQLKMDALSMERILEAEKRQYALSRANIEAINVKCHDIQHQISSGGLGRALALSPTAADIASEINVYDSFMDTGDDALDVILTEKRLLCASEGIELSCIADGAALSGMAPADVYSLFGNALDNAIEAVREVDDPGRRTISLVVRRHGNMAGVSVENYAAHEASFVDGLPQTTKPDRANHGFGMRSMQMVAERYGGSLAASQERGVFRLSVLLPVPDAPSDRD